jgi:hypothetical protein
MAIKTFEHKHGSTFRAEIAATVNGDPLDLSTTTITSQIRAAQGSFRVPGVVVDMIDVTTGKFAVVAKDTTQWPVGMLEWDVRMTGADDTVSSTETVFINCVREVTR